MNNKKRIELTFICPACGKPNRELHLHRFAIELEHMHRLPRRYDVYYRDQMIGSVRRMEVVSRFHPAFFTWVATRKDGAKLEETYDLRREAVAALVSRADGSFDRNVDYATRCRAAARMRG